MASHMASTSASRLQKPHSKSIEPTDSLVEVERHLTIERPYTMSPLEIPDTLATCFSFMRLPPEIRDQIYSYLLSTKYTWQDNEGTQMGYDPWCPHYYHFHLAILRTSRQVNREASYIFYSGNLFVKFRTSFPDPRKCDLPYVAIGPAAVRAINCAMKVTLRMYPGDAQYRNNEIHQTFVLAADDITTFCKALLRAGTSSGSHLLARCSLLFSVNVGEEEEEAADSYWGRQSASLIHNRLLEPFRSLHSLYGPRIEGPVDPRYKADILKSICKQAPSHEEILRNVCASLEQGIEAFESSKYHLALSTFEAAMVEHDSLPIYYDDPMTIVENGIFAGLPLHKAAAQLKSSLRIKLSETYLQLEQYEQAHDCSELALSAIGEYKQDTGCDLGGICPAEFYALMAYASEGLGQVRDALPEMVLASEEEPGKENLAAEVKRLRRVLRESGQLFLSAEPDDPEWKIREDEVIEQGRRSLEHWKRPRKGKRVEYRVHGRVDFVQYFDADELWR